MPRKNTPFDMLEKVEWVNGDKCWEWKNAITKSGYGKTHYNGKEWRAHRLFYYLYYNKIPKVCMHKCDNRKCCNPYHLINGTHKKNMKDMAIKKRAARQSGTQHGQSKYTEEQIKQIRDEYKNGKSITELSVQNKMHREYIRQIVLRKRWRHI